MHITTLRKVGGSTMLPVPPALLDVLQLKTGKSVGLKVEDGCLVVEPQSQPRYSLAELLAQCDSSVEMSGDERVWLDSKPVGRELI